MFNFTSTVCSRWRGRRKRVDSFSYVILIHVCHTYPCHIMTCHCADYAELCRPSSVPMHGFVHTWRARFRRGRIGRDDATVCFRELTTWACPCTSRSSTGLRRATQTPVVCLIQWAYAGFAFPNDSPFSVVAAATGRDYRSLCYKLLHFSWVCLKKDDSCRGELM